MPKKRAAVDGAKCHPEQCGSGICHAVQACGRGVLFQEGVYEVPIVNPAKWCDGCTDCVKACPFSAIRMARYM